MPKVKEKQVIEVMITSEEEHSYFLKKEISELDRKYHPGDMIKLSEKEIKEIEKGFDDYEKLQEKIEKLYKKRRNK